MNNIRIMLVDDHALIREGISNSLTNQAHIEVVAQACSGEEALVKLEDQSVDVVIMDISMKGMGGVEATRQITGRYPGVHVLVLTIYNEETRIIDMLRAGASGYILKSTNMRELLEAIEVVAKGESYFAKDVSARIMNQFRKRKSANETVEVHLTKREKQILKLIAEEFTNHEIAERLFISSRTVDTHRRNLVQKLNAKNTAGLVRYAIKNRITVIE